MRAIAERRTMKSDTPRAIGNYASVVVVVVVVAVVVFVVGVVIFVGAAPRP